MGAVSNLIAQRQSIRHANAESTNLTLFQRVVTNSKLALMTLYHFMLSHLKIFINKMAYILT